MGCNFNDLPGILLIVFFCSIQQKTTGGIGHRVRQFFGVDNQFVHGMENYSNNLVSTRSQMIAAVAQDSLSQLSIHGSRKSEA